LLAVDDHAKGRIWHRLFIVVLYRPFHAQKVLDLIAGVGLYLHLVVEVAVVVAVVTVLFVIFSMSNGKPLSFLRLARVH
jgi:hypothetical protein